MILDRKTKCGSYEISGVPGSFWAASDDIQVSTHAFHTVFEPYEDSWGTMVTLRTPTNSLAKETSSRFLYMGTSPQSSTKYLT